MISGMCSALWNEAKRAVLPPRGVSDDDVKLLVHETLSNATMVAVAATGINAAGRGHPAAELAEAAMLLPQAPPLYSRFVVEAVIAGPEGETLTSLGRLYEAAEAARSTCTGIADMGHGRERQLRLVKQKTTLQDLCGIALSAIADVEALAAERRIPPDLRLPNVALILKSARDGGMPCIGSDGRLTVPDWLQRRAQQRWPVRFTVDLVSARSADVATALDISTSGLGIACFGSFQAGDTVTMRVPDGRMLNGVIAWRQMRRAGIHFDTPLDTADPLLGAPYRVLERRG